MSGQWSLGASTLGAPGESLAAVIDVLIANQASYVELRAASDALVSTGMSSPERRELRARLADAGLAVLAVASGVRLGDPRTDGEVVADLEAHAQLAADLGAPFVRVFPGIPVHDCPFDEVPRTMASRTTAEAQAAERLAAGGRRADGLGIRLAVETHDSNPRGSDIRRLLDQAGSGPFAVIWDLLHPWRVGESPEDTVAALAPELTSGRGYVQIKDVASRRVLTPVLQGEGRVPMRESLDLLRSVGYAGPVSLEWERTWYPDVPPLRDALPAARTALDSLASGRATTTRRQS